ncbi:nucleotide sugar dehydrogenase [Kallipyga gabonensis]|uniref:nucleotide sugar dehydrogenase n=1 Tax=Kallipyga gabonensis TaxID=1686287 RepID=UPI0006B52F94|nr:nucleotide sugar dehydrogenase [Kallipyga gabonensis]
MKEEILKKIEGKEMVCGVAGLGYVGLPLAVEMAKAGFHTIGFDVQEAKVNKVNRGENYIGDIQDDDLAQKVKEGILEATCDFSRVGDVDFIAICVPTPLDMYQQPDISYVKSSTESIGQYITEGTTVVLESTTYPGTTEELLLPILEEESGLACGEDFFLGFSPERVDPGNAVYKTKNTPKVVGGIGEEATEIIAAMYESILDTDIHKVSSPAVAEMEKLLENTYRNINIGLVNELAMLCDRMGISIWEVVDAAKTKPYGFQAFYPGPGLGGHCIPLDPYYLSWKAREFGFHTSMIESSMTVNDRMPEYTVDRAARLLNDQEKSLKGSRVLLLGVAYKNDIDDYRESPAIDVYEILKERGANVDFYDPYIPSFKSQGHVYEGLKELTADQVKEADLLVITTAHQAFDYDMLVKNAKMIFDTRNGVPGGHALENVEAL